MAVSIISLIAKVIANYKGYRRDREKEEDIIVRMAIMRKLNEVKNHIRKFSIENKKTKKIIDEIDIFVKEIEYSILSHKYPFFSSQCSLNKDKIKKLIEHDFLISKKLEEVKNSLGEKRLDLSKIYHAIKDLKIIYINRESFLKSVD